MTGEVLDHEAAAHDRGQTNGTPERQDLRREVNDRAGESDEVMPTPMLREGGRLGFAAVLDEPARKWLGLSARTAGLYQIFLTASGPRWMPPLGISCQFFTASSQPARREGSGARSGGENAAAGRGKWLPPILSAVCAR